MKYRIINKNNRWFPQKKRFLFWRYFIVPKYKTENGFSFQHYDDCVKLCFKRVEDAKKFIYKDIIKKYTIIIDDY